MVCACRHRNTISKTRQLFPQSCVCQLHQHSVYGHTCPHERHPCSLAFSAHNPFRLQEIPTIYQSQLAERLASYQASLHKPVVKLVPLPTLTAIGKWNSTASPVTTPASTPRGNSDDTLLERSSTSPRTPSIIPSSPWLSNKVRWSPTRPHSFPTPADRLCHVQLFCSSESRTIHGCWWSTQWIGRKPIHKRATSNLMAR